MVCAEMDKRKSLMKRYSKTSGLSSGSPQIIGKLEGFLMNSEYKFPHIEGERTEILYNGEWKQGVIVAGYRFRDGIVTIQTDDGEKIWCGEYRTDLYRKISD